MSYQKIKQNKTLKRIESITLAVVILFWWYVFKESINKIFDLIDGIRSIFTMSAFSVIETVIWSYTVISVAKPDWIPGKFNILLGCLCFLGFMIILPVILVL